MNVLLAYFAHRFINLHEAEKLDYILSRKKLLYYNNTANNSCVVVKIVNDAYERQFKEALLVYGSALKLNAAGILIPTFCFTLIGIIRHNILELLKIECLNLNRFAISYSGVLRSQARQVIGL